MNTGISKSVEQKEIVSWTLPQWFLVTAAVVMFGFGLYTGSNMNKADALENPQKTSVTKTTTATPSADEKK